MPHVPEQWNGMQTKENPHISFLCFSFLFHRARINEDNPQFMHNDQEDQLTMPVLGPSGNGEIFANHRAHEKCDILHHGTSSP